MKTDRSEGGNDRKPNTGETEAAWKHEACLIIMMTLTISMLPYDGICFSLSASHIVFRFSWIPILCHMKGNSDLKKMFSPIYQQVKMGRTSTSVVLPKLNNLSSRRWTVSGEVNRTRFMLMNPQLCLSALAYSSCPPDTSVLNADEVMVPSGTTQ